MRSESNVADLIRASGLIGGSAAAAATLQQQSMNRGGPGSTSQRALKPPPARTSSGRRDRPSSARGPPLPGGPAAGPRPTSATSPHLYEFSRQLRGTQPGAHVPTAPREAPGPAPAWPEAPPAQGAARSLIQDGLLRQMRVGSMGTLGEEVQGSESWASDPRASLEMDAELVERIMRAPRQPRATADVPVMPRRDLGQGLWDADGDQGALARSSARDGALLGTGSGPATSRPSSGAGAAGRPTSASQATGAAPSRDAAAKRPQSARSPDRQRTAPAVPWVHAGAPVSVRGSVGVSDPDAPTDIPLVNRPSAAQAGEAWAGSLRAGGSPPRTPMQPVPEAYWHTAREGAETAVPRGAGAEDAAREADPRRGGHSVAFDSRARGEAGPAREAGAGGAGGVAYVARRSVDLARDTTDGAQPSRLGRGSPGSKAAAGKVDGGLASPGFPSRTSDAGSARASRSEAQSMHERQKQRKSPKDMTFDELTEAVTVRDREVAELTAALDAERGRLLAERESARARLELELSQERRRMEQHVEARLGVEKERYEGMYKKMLEFEEKWKELFKDSAKLKKDVVAEREKARALMLEQTKHKALIEGAEAAEAKHKVELEALKRAHKNALDRVNAEKLQAVEDQRRVVEETREKLLNRLQEVKAESTSWEESCLRERARAQKLERDLTKLQKKWEMDNNAATVSQMEARVGEMTEQLESLEEQVSEKDHMIKGLKANLEATKTKLGDMTANCSHLEATLRAERTEHLSRLRQVDEANRASLEECARVQGEFESIVDFLTGRVQRLLVAQAALDAAGGSPEGLVKALQTQGKGRVKYLSLMVDRVADHNARLLRRVAQLEDQLRNAKWGGALGHGGRGVEPIGTTPLLDTTVISSYGFEITEDENPFEDPVAFLQRLQATREGQQDAQGTSPRPTATPAPTVGFGAMDRWGGDADSRAGDSKGMIRGPPAVRTRPHSAAVPASPTMGAMGGAWGLAGVREGPSSPARVRPGDGALLPFDLGNGVMGADGESIAKLRQFADTQVMRADVLKLRARLAAAEARWGTSDEMKQDLAERLAQAEEMLRRERASHKDAEKEYQDMVDKLRAIQTSWFMPAQFKLVEQRAMEAELRLEQLEKRLAKEKNAALVATREAREATEKLGSVQDSVAAGGLAADIYKDHARELEEEVAALRNANAELRRRVPADSVMVQIQDANDRAERAERDTRHAAFLREKVEAELREEQKRSRGLVRQGEKRDKEHAAKMAALSEELLSVTRASKEQVAEARKAQRDAAKRSGQLEARVRELEDVVRVLSKEVEVARGDTEYLRARTKFNAGGGVHESSSWAEDGAVAPGRQMPQLSTVGFVVQVP